MGLGMWWEGVLWEFMTGTPIVWAYRLVCGCWEANFGNLSEIDGCNSVGAVERHPLRLLYKQVYYLVVKRRPRGSDHEQVPVRRACCSPLQRSKRCDINLGHELQNSSHAVELLYSITYRWISDT